jgi:hypothetical protein
MALTLLNALVFERVATSARGLDGIVWPMMFPLSFYSTLWRSEESCMADTIQFTLNSHEVETYHAWRAEVEAATGQPLTGLYLSFVLTTSGLRQIIVRPSTDADLKLHNIPRDDGTLDQFVPHAES